MVIVIIVAIVMVIVIFVMDVILLVELGRSMHAYMYELFFLINQYMYKNIGSVSIVIRLSDENQLSMLNTHSQLNCYFNDGKFSGAK